MAKLDQWYLWSTGTQVQSPSQQSDLRIQHCSTCGIGLNCSLDLIPGPGTPYAQGWKKRKKNKRIMWWEFLLCLSRPRTRLVSTRMKVNTSPRLVG